MRRKSWASSRRGPNARVEARVEARVWNGSAYVTGKNHAVQSEYRVSFVFELLSRTAEEMADQTEETTPEFVGEAGRVAGGVSKVL